MARVYAAGGSKKKAEDSPTRFPSFPSTAPGNDDEGDGRWRVRRAVLVKELLVLLLTRRPLLWHEGDSVRNTCEAC